MLLASATPINCNRSRDARFLLCLSPRLRLVTRRKSRARFSAPLALYTSISAYPSRIGLKPRYLVSIHTVTTHAHFPSSAINPVVVSIQSRHEVHTTHLHPDTSCQTRS
jgi:hypothetical protein